MSAVCSDPFTWCGMLLFKLVSTIAILAALDTTLADPSICAPLRYLFWAETLCPQSLRTFGSFPWRTFCLLQLDALVGVLTRTTASLFAPLERWKMLLELHSLASHAPIWRHVPFFSMASQSMSPTHNFCINYFGPSPGLCANSS